MSTDRFYVPLKNQQFPVIISYRDLVKSRRKEQLKPVEAPPIVPDSADNDFFAGILERAKNYSLTDGDDVDDNASEGDDDPSADKSKRAVGEDYDFDDPFIDDSDLLFEDPQTSSHPEYDGWFVYHGTLDGNDQLTTKRDKTKTTSSTATKKKATTTKQTKEKTNVVKKDKEKTASTTAKKTNTATSSSSSAMGSTSSQKSSQPEPSTSTGIADKEQSKKSSSTSTATPTASTSTDKKAVKPTKSSSSETTTPKKKVASSETRPLSPEIHALLEKLKQDAVHEDFKYKAKFPPNLRPTTLDIGRLMYREKNMLDNNLITHLMNILPYNRFTLTKFLTTKTGPERVQELQEELNTMIEELKSEVNKLMPEQNRQHSEKVASLVAAKAKGGDASTSTDDPAFLPKFKWNEELRQKLYNILKVDQAIITISNDIANYTKQDPVNEVRARKQIHQRLLSCWPEGWMTTGELSRTNSAYKVKMRAKSSSATSTRRQHNTTTDSKNVIGTAPPQSDQDKVSDTSTATTAKVQGAKREAEPHPNELDPSKRHRGEQGVIVIPDDQPTDVALNGSTGSGGGGSSSSSSIQPITQSTPTTAPAMTPLPSQLLQQAANAASIAQHHQQQDRSTTITTTTTPGATMAIQSLMNTNLLHNPPQNSSSPNQQ